MPFARNLILSLCLLTAGPLLAEWSVESSQTLGTASDAISHVRKRLVNGRDSATFDIVFLDPKKCALRVIDDAAGSSSLGDAMQQASALAGVNGGYFHPDRTPLGLVVADGRRIHPVERAKLLSGILSVTRDRVSLWRAVEFKPPKQLDQALQAGPFLIDRGKAVSGLDAKRTAARTMVLSDGAGRTALAICQSGTLAETAQMLAAPGAITEMKLSRVMNLDGGSSTALWVHGTSRPFYVRELKSVRNYLAVIPGTPTSRAWFLVPG